jgi:hypothetical protein
MKRIMKRPKSIKEGERRIFMSKVWLITGSGNGLGGIAEAAMAASQTFRAEVQRGRGLAFCWILGPPTL